MNTQKQQLIIVGLIALILGLVIGFCASACGHNRHMKGGHGDMQMMRKGMDKNMMHGPGSNMRGMMMDMNAGLMGKTGDEFDKAFIDEMVMHHQGAVDMAKQVLATSKRPELIKLANDIITAQTKEIQMMDTWKAAWFK